MAKIIRGKNSTILNYKETTGSFELSRIIVLKTLVDIKENSDEYLLVKNYIDSLVDEPVIFVVKQRDRKSIALAKLFYRYKILSLDEIKTLNKSHTSILFIMSNYKSKIEKILEIICNKVFNKSILIV